MQFSKIVPKFPFWQAFHKKPFEDSPSGFKISFYPSRGATVSEIRLRANEIFWPTSRFLWTFFTYFQVSGKQSFQVDVKIGYDGPEKTSRVSEPRKKRSDLQMVLKFSSSHKAQPQI